MSILLDGREVKVGDRLWSFIHGWVIVQSVAYSVPFPLLAKTEAEGQHPLSFTSAGQWHFENKRVLFWDEIKFEIPKPPKKKVKKYRYAYQVRNIPLISSAHYKDDKDFLRTNSSPEVQAYIRLDFTEREVEE